MKPVGFISERDPFEAAVKQAFGTQTPIGACEPCRESKWTGWRVLLVDGNLVACVTDQGGDYVCSEVIAESKLGMYVDDEEMAQAELCKQKGE